MRHPVVPPTKQAEAVEAPFRHRGPNGSRGGHRTSDGDGRTRDGCIPVALDRRSTNVGRDGARGPTNVHATVDLGDGGVAGDPLCGDRVTTVPSSSHGWPGFPWRVLPRDDE